MDKVTGLRARVHKPYDVEFFNFDIDKLAEDEVLIAIKASAICGSDLHIFKGKHPLVPLPATIGHEMAGDIVSMGDKVSNFKLGDRVTFEPCTTCGVCENCLKGDYGYCEKITFVYRVGEGSMATHIVAKAKSVYKLPENLSYNAGALIEPLSVATHAVRRADIKLGDNVLVIGEGAIGILVAAICKRNGASNVIIAGLDETKLQIAKDLGATHSINSKEYNVPDEVMKITNGVGVDKSFECVGKEVTFLQAVHALRKSGLLTVMGIFEEPNIQFNITRLVTHELKIQGTQGYCWDFEVALELSKVIDLEKIITHAFSLNEMKKALETAFVPEEKSIKIIINP